MRVRNLMTAQPFSCRPDDNLSVAAMIMWNHDCGVVPVVDGENKVVGVITDRDICMAAVLENRPVSMIRVEQTMSNVVYAVDPDDDADDALAMMSEKQVKRLVVTEPGGELAGILSASDVIRNSDRGKSKKHVANKSTLKMLRALNRPRTNPARKADAKPVDSNIPVQVQEQVEATDNPVVETESSEPLEAPILELDTANAAAS